MNARLLVVVSGLPASGKTTVGRALSDGLSLPLIDKDDILEALFERLGRGNSDQRHRLSRASDEVLFTLATTSRAAVVVNWWNHDDAPAHLGAITDSLVQVFCNCPVDVAAARFDARERHPGHLDGLRTDEHPPGIRSLPESRRGPLETRGALVTIDTSGPVDIESFLEEVRTAVTDEIEAPRLRLDSESGSSPVRLSVVPAWLDP